MDEACEVMPASEDRHLQGIESKVGPQGSGRPPAHDPAAEGIDNERGVGKAGGRPDVGEIGDPEPIGGRRGEGPFDKVDRSSRLIGGSGGPNAAHAGRAGKVTAAMPIST